MVLEEKVSHSLNLTDQLKEILAKESSEAPDQSNVLAEREEWEFAQAKIRAEHDAAFRKAQLKSIQQDIDERKGYADKLFRLISIWLACIIATLWLNGQVVEDPSENPAFRVALFSLSDQVLLALIGGTTVSVLGLFVIVTNYLFPKKTISPSDLS